MNKYAWIDPRSCDRRTRWNVVAGAAAGFLVAAGGLSGHVVGFSNRHTEGVLAVGVIVGALTVVCGWGRWFGYIAIALALMSIPVTCTGFTLGPTTRWIRRDPIPETPLDAVVVLSGAIDDWGYLNGTALSRLIGGMELMQRNHAHLFITTRVSHADGRGGVATSDDDQRAIVSLGIDTSMWRIAYPASTTHDEAMRTASILAPASAHTIAVVTSPLHSRRACAVFEGVGFRVICAPSTEREYDIRTQHGVYDRARALSDYAYERLGMVKYRALGWIR
jgi:uncharacterized SAM-binding protein YcdF (DUF218 family)